MQSAAQTAVEIGFVATFIVVFLIGRVLRPRQRFERNFRKPNYRACFDGDRGRDLATARQLRAVMAASFGKKKVLNWSEYGAFKIVDDEISRAYRGHRVCVQTSLGEILSSPSNEAFLAINNKRTDMLIVDQSGFPVLAIEYQGGGHYQGTAIARDTIKREALRKAGVGYLEIFETDRDDDIRRRLRQHLGSKREAALSAASAVTLEADRDSPWRRRPHRG